ncbi:hypothetical protein EYF80_036355 [Liparis tanakae]|uniref:Uncharacterized protein n=1 Tax=Liparis tanakae TaxID=230148 RepID=A0A4Z2GJL4_9TELE|nr:hypothetical protein EYF80_036355 [Liparis tanakae]
MDIVRREKERKVASRAAPRGSLEFGLAALARVLPADEADEVVHAGVGDGHHRHGVHLLLGELHREVDVDLLRGRRPDVALKQEKGVKALRTEEETRRRRKTSSPAPRLSGPSALRHEDRPPRGAHGEAPAPRLLLGSYRPPRASLGRAAGVLMRQPPQVSPQNLSAHKPRTETSTPPNPEHNSREPRETRVCLWAPSLTENHDHLQITPPEGAQDGFTRCSTRTSLSTEPDSRA